MLQDHPEGTIISIRLQPSAKRSAIVGPHGDALKIAVTAPPEDSRANKMLLQLLAEQLDLNRSQIELLSGATNRNKRVLVRSLYRQDLMRRIGHLISAKKTP
jgi:uncharacterized protein (TIGR00251 family)